METLSYFECIAKRLKGVSGPKNPSGVYAPGVSHLVADWWDEVKADENCTET